jgi:hypothetical protein
MAITHIPENFRLKKIKLDIKQQYVVNHINN